MSVSGEFASIALARSFIETLHTRINSSNAQEQVDTLKRLDVAYQEFPELELDCPLREWLNACQAAATARPDREVIPLLIYCMALDPSESSVALVLERIAVSEYWRLLPRIIRLLHPRELPWRFIEPIVGRLREAGRPQVIASLVSELWDCKKFGEGAGRGDLESVLSYLLGDQNLLGTDSARIVQSARSRLPEISQDWKCPTSREELLGLVERLRLERPGPRSNPRLRVFSITGRVSFTEFLRQWPAEIELSSESDDAGFVAEAYRVILLRSPETDELNRCLGLLQNDAISRRQILEELLASGEFEALERRLRLVWKGEVIVRSGRSMDRQMPAVIWPSGLTPVTLGDSATTGLRPSGLRPSPAVSNAHASRTACPLPKALVQRSFLEPSGRLSRSLEAASEQSGNRAVLMRDTRQHRLDQFNSHIYGCVEGWLGDRMSQIIEIIGAILDEQEVAGHVAEFGVHHGLFLFLLNTLRNSDERCYAIDMFDNQSRNLDHSGQGSLAMLLSHVETLMPSELQFFRVVQRDTTSFSLGEIRELFGEKGVKIFSVDAGHTALHTRNDLQLVQEVLVPGGVVALDDYMSVHWPGVTEGFYRFFERENRRLKPFAYFQNKLFLTTISEHASWLQQFRRAIEARYRDEVRARRWKEVEIAGSDCLSFA